MTGPGPLTSTTSCRNEEVSASCVCQGGGWSTGLKGGQYVSRKRQSSCAVEEGWGTQLSVGAELQATSRLQGLGQRKWGAAAGGGPWGEKQQQI